MSLVLIKNLCSKSKMNFRLINDKLITFRLVTNKTLMVKLYPCNNPFTSYLLVKFKTNLFRCQMISFSNNSSLNRIFKWINRVQIFSRLLKRHLNSSNKQFSFQLLNNLRKTLKLRIYSTIHLRHYLLNQTYLWLLNNLQIKILDKTPKIKIILRTPALLYLWAKTISMKFYSSN